MEKNTRNPVTRFGRVIKRPANLNLSIGPKAKRERLITPKKKKTTKAMGNAADELERMRARMQLQQQEMDQARAALEAARQQQVELGQVREQLLAIQGQRDEAHRMLNQLQQNGVPVAQQPNAQPNQQNGGQDGQLPAQVPNQNASNNLQNVSVRNFDICNLVSAIGSSQLDYKIPKFSNENECHPLEFLDKMEKFFRIKNINDEKKLVSIEIALEGNARLWFNLTNDFDTYENFKLAFQARFFSIPIQVKIKNMWATRKYSGKRDDSFQNYYYQQAKEASYIQPKISEYEKNYIIIKQFPWWVQEALATANFNDANAISHTLANLDAIHFEKQAKQESRQAFHSENKYMTQQNGTQTISVQSMQAFGQNQNNYRHYNNNRGNKRFRYNHVNKPNNNSNSGNIPMPNIGSLDLPDTRYPPTNYNSNDNSNANANMPTNFRPENLNS